MTPKIPREELLYSGNAACQGCGALLGMRHCLKALGEDTMVVVPASCWTILSGAFPTTAFKLPMFHAAFETGASTACGVKAGLRMIGKGDTTVLTWAGDGGTSDIGIQSLSGAAERNDDFIYICYDNEGYMNTGIQRSSATPYGAWTSTTPESNFKKTQKKDIAGILAAHNIPYLATASIAYPEDFIAKVKKAKSIKGLKFLHLLMPCPAGWRYPSQRTIELARLSVQTGVFPLYEVIDGKYIVKKTPNKKPVKEYLLAQGRFRHLKDDVIQVIQKDVDKRLEVLLKKEKLFE